jgi:NAD(P)-dependent dehydrogenase (short-subunit alcohol dehydrogenase family)
MAFESPESLKPLRLALLNGKRVIITGGAGGIGRPTAALFAAMGAQVSIFDVAETTKGFAASLGAGHRGDVVDVTDGGACRTAVDATVAAFGGLDVLVTMAGLVHPGGTVELSRGDFDATIAMHLDGTFNMCQAALPVMRAQGQGVIVCMSSIAGERGGGLRGGVHYAAAKAGILGLMRAMARENAQYGVRVNAVCPGAIHTGKRKLEDMNAMFGAQIPMGRVGFAEEVARVFAFLASDLSTYMTGATIDVNGGMHIH